MLVAAAVLGAVVFAVWRQQLFTVSRPGETPRPLAALEAAGRRPLGFDAVLRAVPVGMRRLAPGQGVLLIHYWAPWERNGRAQIRMLDSLQHTPGMEGLTVAVVCFDPFPSVARFVARQRLRVMVLLDHGRELRASLPCPSVPYTYVFDRAGRVAVEQPGEVDWLAPATRRALEALLAEPGAAPAAPPAAVRPPAGS